MKHIFGSEHYQGRGKRNYFEGWYFRHTGEFPFSFIAGVSQSRDEPHSFIQYIDAQRSAYFTFRPDEFRYERDGMRVHIGDNEFSADGLAVDLGNGSDRLCARVTYGRPVAYKKSLYAPSVMGPFSYLPMPCNHALVSLDHAYSGRLVAGGAERQLCGRGYIEKDYGKSFPENYVWLHAADGDLSLMCAVAWPLVLGMRGFLCVLSYRGRQYNLSLYTGARLRRFACSSRATEIEISRGDLCVRLCARNNELARRLLAPAARGRMITPILENLAADCQADCRIDGQTVNLSGRCALECVFTD